MDDRQDRALYPPQEPFSTGLAGRCPRCGEGRLFKGFLSLNKSCANCGLDFAFAEQADGPAVFVMFIAGAIVVGLALFVEFTYAPPLWLHAVLWTPVILVLSVGMLRPLKGIFTALQYRNRAAEAKAEDFSS